MNKVIINLFIITVVVIADAFIISSLLHNYLEKEYYHVKNEGYAVLFDEKVIDGNKGYLRKLPCDSCDEQILVQTKIEQFVSKYNLGEVNLYDAYTRDNLINASIELVESDREINLTDYIITIEGDMPKLLLGRALNTFVFTLFALLLTYAIYFHINKYSASYSRIAAREDEVNLKAKTAVKETESKSMFLANISHELRTPLNSIIGFSEIIKSDVNAQEQNRAHAKDINDAGNHLLALINDILDYSKLESGKLEIHNEEVDITKIIRKTLRLVQTKAEETNVRLIPDIPAEHYVLKVDPKRIRQVILNILTNAIKFTPNGGSVTLITWVSKQGDEFVIEVQDSGIGIPKDKIPMVLESFSQVDNKYTRQKEGTGLGLPISKKLVEQMGGRLNIESDEGQGTAVQIIMPYKA